MPDGGFGCVVRSLWLGHVNDSAGHGTDHDDATLRLPCHQVFSDFGAEKVCAVDVYTPELLNTVRGIFNSIKVLRETRRGDKMVDLAVGFNDLSDRGLDRIMV